MHWQPPSPFLSVNNSVAVKSAISGDRLSEFKVQLLPVWPWASDLISLSSIFLFLAAAAAAKSLQSCPTLCDTTVGSPPQSLGFSRQEHWSGLPSPSPLHESEKWKGSRSVVSDSVRPHGLPPTRLLRPWDFPGKSTGVGCHCLLVTKAMCLLWGEGRFFFITQIPWFLKKNQETLPQRFWTPKLSSSCPNP